MLKAALVSGLLGLTLAGQAGAQTSDAARLYQKFFETETERCSVKAAVEPKWKVIRVDMDGIADGTGCVLTEQGTVDVFAGVFKAHKDTGDENPYVSLMVGDVEQYSWMQRHRRLQIATDLAGRQQERRLALTSPLQAPAN